MKIEKQMVIAFAVIGVIGGASIFTLPLRGSEPMPESGLTTEPCTLDLEVARVEEEIESRKAVLDSMLESAVMVKEAKVVETATETEQVTTGEPESETVEETTTEEETEAPESSDEVVTEVVTEVVEIFEPVDSLMAPDLQAWTYAHCIEAGVDPYIVMAICERESACTACIFGDNGRAYGMMQIHPVWVMDKLSAHGYSTDDLLMAQPNITIGVEILQDFLAEGKGIEWALTAYRYGPQVANGNSSSDYSAWILSRAEQLRR